MFANLHMFLPLEMRGLFANLTAHLTTTSCYISLTHLIANPPLWLIIPGYLQAWVWRIATKIWKKNYNDYI